MTSVVLGLLVAQPATFPFPTELRVPRGSKWEASLSRTYTDRAEELELVQVDAVQTEWRETQSENRRILFQHKVRPVSESLDGLTRRFATNTEPQIQEEWRSINGAQFRFSTALDDGDGLMRLSRFLTVPLPDKAPEIGGAWEFNDRRHLPYQFRGRVLGFEDGAWKVRVFFSALEDPKYTANGHAWLGANGWPIRIDITASPVAIPGGEGNPVVCRTVYRLIGK